MQHDGKTCLSGLGDHLILSVFPLVAMRAQDLAWELVLVSTGPEAEEKHVMQPAS